MKNSKDFIFLVLLVFITLAFAFPSFINLNYLPSGIDTPANLFREYFMEQAIFKNITLKWNSYWYAGSPFLSLYPPFADFLLLGFNSLFKNITVSYNILRFSSYLILTLLSYFFIKRQTKNQKLALISAFLVLTSYPIFHNIYGVGRIATSIGLIFYFSSIILFLDKNIFENSKKKLLLALFIGLTFWAHPFLALAFLPSFAVISYQKSYYKKLYLKKILTVFTIAFIISLPYFYNFIETYILLQPKWFVQKPSINDLIKMIFGNVGDQYLVYLGIFHFVFFILGAYYVIKTKSKLGIFFITQAILFFILTLGGNLPFYDYIPFYQQFDINRFQLLFALFSSLIGGFGIIFISTNLRRRFSNIAILFLLSIVLIDIYPMTYEAQNWQPSADFSKIQLDSNYRALGIGFRHWDSYFIPVSLKMENIIGWFQQTDPHYNFTQTLQSSGGFWYFHNSNFPLNNNNLLLKNLLQLSNTKYIIFAKNWVELKDKDRTIGTYNTNNFLNLEFEKRIENDSDFKKIYSSNATDIFTFKKNISFCEVVKPFSISSNLDISNIFSTQQLFPQIPVSEKISDLNYSQDTVVTCNRLNPEKILIETNKPAWILVKESFYPKWTAYGKKIYNEYGFMLLFVNGSTELVYK